MVDVKAPYRLPLLIMGFLSLGIGVGAGLARLGLHFPLPSPNLTLVHGALMVSGFFGTLISLERAVALGRVWAYGGPLFGGLGGLSLIGGVSGALGPLLLTLASAVLLLASLSVLLRQKALFTLTLALGAASWFGGNLLWLLGGIVQVAVPWWVGFLILTIAGERLELSRFLPPSPRAQALFAAIVAAFIAAIALVSPAPAIGWPFFAVALIAIAIWLVRFDIARRTVRERGLTRFIAVALLSGYFWLGVAGVIGLLETNILAHVAARDAFLHSVFIGFVFSMVFGHAAIILPAVTRLPVPYHPAFYLHLSLLHLTLAARVIGDLAGLPDLRLAGSIGNAVTILLFVLNTITAVVRGLRARRQLPARQKVAT